MDLPEQKVVAIISVKNELHPQLGKLYYQVTIDPANVHEDFIRLGGNDGDEMLGWRPLDTLEVHSILARWEDGAWNPPPKV